MVLVLIIVFFKGLYSVYPKYEYLKTTDTLNYRFNKITGEIESRGNGVEDKWNSKFINNPYWITHKD